jgi:hypothetical protein
MTVPAHAPIRRLRRIGYRLAVLGVAGSFACSCGNASRSERAAQRDSSTSASLTAEHACLVGLSATRGLQPLLAEHAVATVVAVTQLQASSLSAAVKASKTSNSDVHRALEEELGALRALSIAAQIVEYRSPRVPWSFVLPYPALLALSVDHVHDACDGRSSPSTSSGYQNGRSVWMQTPDIPAANVGMYFELAADSLQASDSQRYDKEISALTNLASIPNTDTTAKQQREASADVSLLDRFFVTPGPDAERLSP